MAWLVAQMKLPQRELGLLREAGGGGGLHHRVARLGRHAEGFRTRHGDPGFFQRVRDTSL